MQRVRNNQTFSTSRTYEKVGTFKKQIFINNLHAEKIMYRVIKLTS